MEKLVAALTNASAGRLRPVYASNLEEVVELCLEEMSEEEIKALPEFVGLRSFSIAV